MKIQECMEVEDSTPNLEKQRNSLNMRQILIKTGKSPVISKNSNLKKIEKLPPKPMEIP